MESEITGVLFVSTFLLAFSVMFYYGAPGFEGSDGFTSDVNDLNGTTYDNPQDVYTSFSGMLDTLSTFSNNPVLSAIAVVLGLIGGYAIVKVLPLT